MLLRMKVLLVACLCIVPAVARPSATATATATSTSSSSSSSSSAHATSSTSFSSSSSTASAHAATPKIAILPTTSPSKSGTQNAKREASARWRPVSPARSHSIFRVFNVPSGYNTDENSYEMNDIPSGTLSLFIPPEIPTKEARQLQYFANMPEVPVPAHVHRVLHEAPFFDTIDHAKPILALQQRRKYAGIAPLALKSIRPYFPFFMYE
ncbi:cell wall integrity and stress response component 1-like isoform X2 [Portunus trituberculatus]|uniref:cell wall integrity and stress response component 1-like isoform X2 n=1 Tax=Portunus trituberculatus TaxID=210409 RepID=UPI001E1CDEFD|nr:cell wall integrity and stress response component 1-like isoform X2 [Portunus trituberculatus]